MKARIPQLSVPARSLGIALLLAALVMGALALLAGPSVTADDYGEDEESAERHLALGGLDPVKLVAGAEVEGDAGVTAERGEFIYRFASAESRERFLAEPALYEIQLDGQCATMPTGLGNPNVFTVHDDRIYIFGSDDCREEFRASPAIFLQESASRVAIVLFEGVELLDFAGPGEVFAAAGHGRAFEVYTVGANTAPVTSQGFVEVTPEFTFADAPEPDVVVIPGGGIRSLMGNEAALAWLRSASENAEAVMSVCNGAFVLAELGLLDGLEATTHHGSIAALRNAAPMTRVVTDRRFVDNGKIVTAAGVSSGIDAALHLVARIATPALAARTARYMEYPWLGEEGGEKTAQRAD